MVDSVNLSETLIEYDGRVRIERGPRLFEVAKATPELLSNDITAGHYHRGGRDKFNRIIVIDEFEGDVFGPDRPHPTKKKKDGSPVLIPNSGELLTRGAGPLVKEGQPFAYLNWLEDRENWPWHLYELATEEWTGPNTLYVDAKGEPIPDADGKDQYVIGPSWRRRSMHDDKDSAVAAAVTLANTLAGTPMPGIIVPEGVTG